MANLHVIFPDAAQLTYQSVDAKASLSGICEFKTTEVLYRGMSSVVYKGDLSRDKETVRVVALKIVYGNTANSLRSIEAEYEHYKTLKALQGDVVPECYGLFQAHNAHVACLLLEFCGDPIYEEFEDIPMDLRLDIVENLLEIHGRGIQHNDFEPRNVVVRAVTGKPVIIDFEHATRHDCKCTADIEEGAYPPCQLEFGCHEIYQYTHGSGIWRPGYFLVMNTVMPEMYATFVDEIKQAALRNGVECTSKELDSEAKRVLKLAELIEEHDGCLPRDEVLEKHGIFF